MNPEETEIEAATSTENPIQEEQKTVFSQTLALQNISFEIESSGEGSIRQLTIQPKGLERDNQEITLEVDGQIVSAEIEDLNSDGFPEILARRFPIYNADDTNSNPTGGTRQIQYKLMDGEASRMFVINNITEN